jgi:hypothetical protein
MNPVWSYLAPEIAPEILFPGMKNEVKSGSSGLDLRGTGSYSVNTPIWTIPPAAVQYVLSLMRPLPDNPQNVADQKGHLIGCR